MARTKQFVSARMWMIIIGLFNGVERQQNSGHNGQNEDDGRMVNLLVMTICRGATDHQKICIIVTAVTETRDRGLEVRVKSQR